MNKPEISDIGFELDVLTVLGVDISDELINSIYSLNNPSGEKRGGLGAGCFAFVTLEGSKKSSFININISGDNAKKSPYTLKDLQLDGRFTIVDKNTNQIIASGSIPSSPSRYDQKLTNGRRITDIIQYHNPINLVSIIGNTRCSLFDTNASCSFCSMSGLQNQRSVDELIEALAIIIETDQYRKMITFTSALFDEQGFDTILEYLLKIKETVGNKLTIAFESQPLTDLQLNRLYRIGVVDTLMIPLDFVNDAIQKEHIPGKQELLNKLYRSCLEKAVSLWGSGNVTSNIIVGLDSREETKGAMDRMIDLGVIPEPLSYRDNNSNGIASSQGSLNGAVSYLKKNISIIKNREKTKAGCAACGGCSIGFTANKCS